MRNGGLVGRVMAPVGVPFGAATPRMVGQYTGSSKRAPDTGMTTFTYEAVDAVLTRAKLGISPDDLHGSVTGYLCAGGRGHAHELLTALALESEDAGAMGELQVLLDEMAAGISRDLRTGEPITPLMPAGPLGLRADAMVDWCRGFLGGVALTGELAEAAKASEVRELLDDFSQIAAMHLACNGDDGAALDDVLDFIRGGVKHLHAALVPARRQ